MPSKYLVDSGTLLEGFEDSSQWTASGGTITNDSTIFKEGTKSLKLTSGVGTNCVATKTIATTISDDVLIGFWVYIPSMAEVSSIQVILSPTTDFSSYFSKSYTTLHEGWNYLLASRSDWGATGTPSWSSQMVRLRVRVNAQASQTAIVYYDAMHYARRYRPKVILTFDDGFASDYTVAYPYMRQYGMKGTSFIVSDYINGSNRLTEAQCNTMHDYGWDMCNHTETHTNLTTLDEPDITAEIDNCQAYLVGKGWTRNNEHMIFAYPQGGYDDEVLGAMEGSDISVARCIINRTQANEIDNQYLLTRKSILNTITLAVAKAYIDEIIAQGGVGIFCFHQLLETATASTEWAITDFQALVDYIAARSNLIDVAPMTEWYRGLTSPRKVV